MIEKYLPDDWKTNNRSVITYNHSLMVAKAAKLIAAQCGLDENLAYIYGEMHDIGKFFLQPNEYYKHPRLGYEMLLNYDINIAQVCITHSFPTINHDHIIGFCHKDQKEADTLINILNKTPVNNYIQLIQLCDKISAIDKYISIETKLLWYQEKHHISSMALDQFYCIPLNKIKENFEKISNIDIYKMLYIN